MESGLEKVTVLGRSTSTHSRIRVCPIIELWCLGKEKACRLKSGANIRFCGMKVGFPYDTSLMFFWEFYSMNMPSFAGVPGIFVWKCGS